MYRLCYEDTTAAFPIRLFQYGLDSFSVQYGKQWDRTIPYAKACEKLGQAIMHALACEGIIKSDE